MALKARIDRLIANPTAITKLLWESAAATKNATQRAIRSQRQTMDLIEVRARNTARTRRFEECGACCSAVRQMLNSKPANIRNPNVLKTFCALHSALERPAARITRESLSRAPCLSMSEVQRYLNKMDKLSATWPDSLQVRHVKTLFRSSTRESAYDSGGRILIYFLQSIIEKELCLHVPEIFGAGMLIALQRNLRKRMPVAFGRFGEHGIRRLAVIVPRHALPKERAHLRPCQTAQVVSAGTEQLVRGFHRVLADHEGDPGNVAL